MRPLAGAVAVVLGGCAPGGGELVAVASMSAPRSAALSFALPGGAVLVAGGMREVSEADPGLDRSSEVFDPVTLTWSAAGALQAPRYRPRGVSLASGQPLVLGGAVPGGAGLASLEAYDHARRAWAPAGALGGPRVDPTATLLLTGKVLVVGGNPDNFVSTPPLASAELFDPATGTTAPTGSLHVARAAHAAALGAGGRVLVVGGAVDGAWALTTASVEIYDPGAGTWTEAEPLPAPLFLAYATALASGEVLVAGGCVDDLHDCGPEQRRAHLYDLSSGRRTDLDGLPTGKAGHAAIRLPSGAVLLVGGDNPSRDRRPALRFEPASRRWAEVPATVWHGTWPALALLPGGRALAAGGQTWDGLRLTVVPGAEVYEP